MHRYNVVRAPTPSIDLNVTFIGGSVQDKISQTLSAAFQALWSIEFHPSVQISI